MGGKNGIVLEGAALTIMKLIDLYIIRKFLGTFFFTMALILSISVVFDLSEKIDQFLESDASAWEVVFEYYLNFIIHFGNLFSALFIFISVIWFTSKLSTNSEVVAILSSGVSFRRFLFPYFIGATILTLLSLYLNHFIVPHSNEIRIDFENQYMGSSHWHSNDHIHRQIGPGKLLYFKSYHPRYQRGNHFSLEKWEDDKRNLDHKLFATRAKWDSSKGKWKLNNVMIRRYTSYGDTVQRWSSLDTVLSFGPKDLGQKVSSAKTMTYTELDQKIREERRKGSEDVVHYQLEKHKRSSYPMATYVLTLIGVSIASRKVRGGLGLHIAMGLAVAVSYIFFMKIFTVAATNAGLDPFVAVWIPNGIFLLIALLIYYQAPK